MSSPLMWSLWKLYFCCLIAVIARCEIIHTKLGSLEGGERMSRSGKPYLYWSKIPYAKPPVGNLRLAAPEPADKWEGVLNAAGPLPLCSQVIILAPNRPKIGQEDCLYLTVHKPKNTDRKNLPVLIYLHGGAYFFGHPGPVTSSDYIMDEEVILVTFTYRVGFLGFMSLNDPELPGNFGVKDQVAAVNWVYDNIADFGGDPQQITVFGESAGGSSAHYMLVLPALEGKVARAFMMSGTINKSWSRAPVAVIKKYTEDVISEVNCTRESVKETVECLRNIKHASTITGATMSSYPSPTELVIMAPTIEPPSPSALITEDLTRVSSTKPIVTTFSAGEYLLSEIPNILRNYSRVKEISEDLDGYTRFLVRHRIDDSRFVEEARRIKERYLSHEDIPGLGHDIAMIFQDMTFVYPALDLIDKHTGPKWMYQLVHRGEISLMEVVSGIPPMPEVGRVACHADELVIMFDQRHAYKYAKPIPDPNDVRISKELVKYLVNFATYGNPTPEGSPQIWKPYEGEEILQIKTEGSSHADADFIKMQRDILEFWRSVYL